METWKISWQEQSGHQLDTGTARGLNWAGGPFLGNPLPSKMGILGMRPPSQHQDEYLSSQC